MLFGGATEAKVCGDTWCFANNIWTKIAGDGPPPRTFPAMVMADNYVLLFGGNAVLFGSDKNPVRHLDDTWKFENGHWGKVDAGIHPPARAEAAMAYDPLRKKVVLFGGRLVGEKWVTGDTWEFDGNNWSHIEKPGPTARSGAIMTYDTALKKIVLFGGNPVIAKEKNYNGPMWLWDGDEWSRMPVKTALIFNTCMAYNTAENFILRFGGWTGKKRINSTYIFSNNKWKKLHLKPVPAARNHAIMVYNPGTNSFLMYGGHDGDNVFGDMWEFKNGKWQLLFAEGPLRRLDNGH